MCCLGKIYTDNKNFETYTTIKVNGIAEFEKDNSIPTLIIGKKNAENLFGKDKVKVLNKEIEPNIYWTYSKFEKRSEYEIDVEKFYLCIFNNLLKQIRYTSLNIYTLTYTLVKNSINFIDKKKCRKVALITNNHVYLNFETTILGISLDELNYVGVTKDKFITFLKKHGVNVFYNYQNYNDILKKYLNFSKIAIPYLYKATKE